MPIVQLDLVIREESEKVSPETLQMLTDELGAHFNSEKSGTWVKLGYTTVELYAENGGSLDSSVRPTLVEVLKYELPDEEQLSREADQLADIVARRLGRPKANTHVIYMPEGKGRVAFGGKLVT